MMALMLLTLEILLQIMLFALTHIVAVNCLFVAFAASILIGNHFGFESMTVFFIGFAIFMLLYAIHMSKYGFWVLSFLFTAFWTYIFWDSYFKDYEGHAQRIIVSAMCFFFILFLHLVSKSQNTE